MQLARSRAASPDDRPFAVLDIGSNSARMTVFRLREDEHLDVLEDARAPLRLARELEDDGALGDEAIARTIEALHDFRAIADGAGASRIVAIATSAVREATDGQRLVEEAARLQISIEVIAGETEARLGFLGAVHDLPVQGGLTMDVGGGSVQLGWFTGRRLERPWTLPIGSLRMSDRYLQHDPPTDKDIARLRRAVAAALDETGVPELRESEELVGIGGTVRNLAKVDLRRTEGPLPLLHGYELSATNLGAIVDDLAERPMKRRTQVPGLNPDRADTVVGGGLVVQEVMAHVGAGRLIVSSRGVREGLALDAFGRDVPPAGWVRTISVATLAARFATWDPFVAGRRATIANRLFEALEPSAATRIREMLDHAATLLDVGRAIDYYDRFAHAAQIVIAADLAGFSHEDLAALATILRAADSDEREGRWAHVVDELDRVAVERAASALALADELHRRIPKEADAAISCSWLRDGFEVVAPVPAGWRPRAVAERFSEAFGRPLTVVPTTAVATV